MTKKLLIGGTAAALALTLGTAASASASVYSDNHHVAARRGVTYCHGDLTERTARLVNTGARAHTFTVQTRTRDDSGIVDEQRFRVRVDGQSDAEVSVFTRPGQRSRMLVTYRGEVLLYRAALRPVCW